MREIVLYPGESVTIGDTVIKAAHGPGQPQFIPTVFPVVPERTEHHPAQQLPSTPFNPYDPFAPGRFVCAALVSEIGE